MLPFVFKTFVLSIFEWPLKRGFTVHVNMLSAAVKISVERLVYLIAGEVYPGHAASLCVQSS